MQHAESIAPPTRQARVTEEESLLSVDVGAREVHDPLRWYLEAHGVAGVAGHLKSMLC